MARYFDQPTLMHVGRIAPAYNDHLAWQMAELCRLSYERFEVEGNDSLRRSLSMGEFELVATLSARVVQAFLARRADDDLHVLVFRGTELNWDDIRADMMTKFTRTDSGSMHTGFLKAIESVRKDIDRILYEIDSDNIYVTGHSLGGALAVAAAIRLSQKKRLAACYTFGCPKIGEAKLDFTISTSVYRIVNGQDLVPRLPLRFGTPYQHVGDLRFLARDGRLLRSPGRSIDTFHFILGILTLRNLKNHGISRYCDRLADVALIRLAGLEDVL